MLMRKPSRRIASTWAGHWSICTTSRPASSKLAAMQLPLAPVPSTAIFMNLPRRGPISGGERGASLDVDSLAGDVARAGAEQEARQRREIGRPGSTAEDRPVQRMRWNLVGPVGPRQHGGDQRVDGDPVGRELHRQPTGEAGETGLGGDPM